MRQPEGRPVELPAGRPDRSRRYSPLNRAPGLRRVPDEPIGLAVLSSLLLHAVLVTALVHLTDAPPETGAADISSIMMDVAAAAPGATPPRVGAPSAAARPKPPAGTRSAATRTPTPRAASHRPARVASPPVPTPAAQPIAPPPAGIMVPQVAAIPGEGRANAPAAPPLTPTVEAPAEDAVALMPSVPESAGLPEPPVSPASVPDVSPDPGWPDPSPVALASAVAARPARALIPALVLDEPSPQPSGPAVGGAAPVEPALPVIEPPAPLELAMAPVPSAVVNPETAPKPPVVAPSGRTVTTATPQAEPTRKPAAPATRAEPSSRMAEASTVPATSPFGLSSARALVQLDGPRVRVTDQPARTISGRIVRGAPERLVLYVNGSPTEVSPARRTFEASVTLRPGANELRAVVTGSDGVEAEDTITVQYVPPAPSIRIALTSPPDGFTLNPDDPPVVVVEGEIGDKAVGPVWIVANARRLPVAARGGRFRHVLLLADPSVHLWAETSAGDRVHRSKTVTVRTAGAHPPAGVLVMQWPTGIEGANVEISATWRAHPERLDGAVQTVKLPGAATTGDGSPSDVFYLRGLRPGVYTLIVRYRGAAPLADVRPTLYLPDKDHLTSRALRPVSLNGAGRRVLTKILMPHAILWEQEEWFSGRSESVDTVTKFRIPEGISWVERKADIP